MKHALLALPLTLLMGVAATSAMANSGTINFVGAITTSTCPIEIIDPVSGTPTGSVVNIGVVPSSQFIALGTEVGNREFGLRLTPGGACTVTAGEVANVTFSAPADTTGDYFAFKGLPGSATGVVAALRDFKGTPVLNGKATADYPLNVTSPTDMLFSVAHRSNSLTVTPGRTEADVRFTVDIN